MRSDSRTASANTEAPGRPDLRLILGASMFVPLAWLAMLAPTVMLPVQF